MQLSPFPCHLVPISTILIVIIMGGGGSNKVMLCRFPGGAARSSGKGSWGQGKALEIEEGKGTVGSKGQREECGGQHCRHCDGVERVRFGKLAMGGEGEGAA